MFENFWWIVYLGILGTAAIGMFLKGMFKTTVAKLDFLTSVITWIGLFGYITKIQIFTPIVWKVVFIGGLLWDVIFAFFFVQHLVEDEGELPLALRVFSLLLLTPLYYGLYQYAWA
ncbi:hypothetical protein [Effusibacillus lacus]|uniref:hypothetical protein n=1 Tax=Effusibacillus lacus TaxID=1348429 RepID=UPI000BB8D5D2|nr:hypothetical protein [Effusibacillus lacus]TCS68391.1 hypothetical protein EDD64_1432 [Effusibacillus lacus]